MNRTIALSERMYPELERRMGEEGVSKTRIAKELGTSLRSVVRKCMGESKFTWEEVLCIQEAFFPEDDLKQLFRKKIEHKKEERGENDGLTKTKDSKRSDA